MVGWLLAVGVAACGSDDGGGRDARVASGTSSEEAASGPGDRLPAGCVLDTPVSLTIEGGEVLPGIDGSRFEATTVIGSLQPIVPDPAGELDLEEATRRAAETELVAYTVFLADFPIDDDDIGNFGVTAPDNGTAIAFTVVPPSLRALAAGDVIQGGVPDYDTRTTFTTVGTLYQTGTSPDEPRLAIADADPGEAKVLFLDDERICLSWSQRGPILGGGTDDEWSIDTTIAAELGPRLTLAFS